jgi:hypothetical protein
MMPGEKGVEELGADEAVTHHNGDESLRPGE